jgi:DNA repair exonuclease SbcCD ATPase subunit
MINSIHLKHFQLFKDAEINLDKINVIMGTNLDSQDSSSNGAGKSTIGKSAITYVLYNDVSGINLKDLISFGAKQCSVELHCSVNDEHYIIRRSIPSDLYISVNGKEVQLNTNTLKQKWIDDRFGNYEFFKKFRMVDNKGINILELGIVSLRKELMQFVDDLFSDIRKSLLAKKLERETYNVDKRLYKFALSEKRLDVLKNGLKKLCEDLNLANLDCMEQYKIINDIKIEIQTREKQIISKQRDIKDIKAASICPVLKITCAQLGRSITPEIEKKMYAEIEQLSPEIEQFKENLTTEEDLQKSYREIYDSIQIHIQKVKNLIMKLEEAFKFKEYKFTLKDVTLYTEAIKTLDSFAGYYIETWLKQLELIINDLLATVNLSVSFSAEKDFIRIKDGENELKFEQLSSGQKTFLSSVFKLSILIHRGETSGIILCDEGLGNLDQINLKKFIEVCKQTNFQFVLIYQNIPELEDVKKIEVIREKGVSNAH